MPQQEIENPKASSSQVECSVDAGYSEQREIGYYGFIIRTPNKEFADVGKFDNGIVNTSVRAEVYAIREVVDRLDDLFENTPIVIKTDLKSAAENFQGEGKFRKGDLSVAFRNIKDIASKSCNDFEMEWIPREDNDKADALVEQAILSDNPEEYEASIDNSWTVERQTNGVYSVCDYKGEEICNINLWKNSKSCEVGSRRKCRHWFHLDRQLGKEESHRILEE